MAGFVGGFLSGYKAVDDMQASAQQRDMRQIELDQARQDQQDRLAQRAAMSESMKPTTVNAPADGMGPPQVERPPMHVALSNTAQSLAARGDLDGAEKYTKQAAAYKTLWAEGKISDAWRQGPEALVKVANELSPGANFSIAQGQDGSLTVTGAGVDGQQMSQTFRSKNELGAWAQQIANPGNLFTAFQEQEKRQLEAAKIRAQTVQAQAAGNASQAQAQQTMALTDPKVGLTNAQTSAANANVVQSYAAANASNAAAGRQRAEAANVGIGTIQKNYNDLIGIGFTEDEARTIASGNVGKGKAREQAILDVATKLAAADAQQLGGKPRNQQELMRDATAMVDSAASSAGTARVGSGPAQRVSAPAAKGAPKTPSGMQPEEQQRAAQIRAAVKAGSMSREDAIRELQALGFQ